MTDKKSKLKHALNAMQARRNMMRRAIKDTAYLQNLRTAGCVGLFDVTVLNAPYGGVEFDRDGVCYKIVDVTDFGDFVGVEVNHQIFGDDIDEEMHDLHLELGKEMSWYMSVLASAYADDRDGELWYDENMEDDE